MSSTTAALHGIEFIRALALAWKNLAAYPPGHPALVSSLARVEGCLRDLRGPAGEAVFGIASDGLFYGDLKIDVTAAQKFAHALFSRGVAVLRFSAETTPADIEAFIRVLQAGVRDEDRVPLGDALTAAGIININAQAVHYETVQVTDNLERREQEPKGPVWDEILRALLENRQFASGVREVPHAASVDELSRLLAQYADAADEEMTFDPKATFGVRMASIDGTEHPLYRFLDLTVGEAIASANGARRQHSLDQAVQLIKVLPVALRKTITRAVVRALAADNSAGSALRHFASSLASDEVLDALRYVAAMDEVSQHALQLIESMTTIEGSTRAAPASGAVVSDLVQLFGEEDATRFNPVEYRNAIKNVAVRIPEVPPEAVTSLERLGVRADIVSDTMPEYSRVLFDMLTDTTRSPAAVLHRLEEVFRAHLSRGHYNDAKAIVDELTKMAKSAEGSRKGEFDAAITALAGGNAIRDLIESILRATPETTPYIQHLAHALGSTAQRGLIDALASENNRSRRRKLLDFLTSLGPAIVPEVTQLLSDSRWYVVRNMIVLLRAVSDRTSLPAIRELARHHDLRVRLEAIKTLFALDTAVPSSLLDDMFRDRDVKIAEAAVTLVGAHGIKEAVPSLLRILDGNDIMGGNRKLRIKAVRALSDIGDENALPHLDRFLKPTFLPWPSRDERLAVWESLKGYPETATEPLVERGIRISDPQVRAICSRLAKK